MEMKNYDDEAAVRFLRNSLDDTYKRKDVVTTDIFVNLTDIVNKILKLSGRPFLVGYTSFNDAGLFYETKPACIWGTKLYFTAPKQMEDPYNWHVEMGVTLYTSALPLSLFPGIDKKKPDYFIFTGAGDRGFFVQVHYYEPVDCLKDGIIFFNEKLLEVQRTRSTNYLLDFDKRAILYPRESNDIKKYFLEKEEIEGFKQFLLYFLKKSEKMIQCKI